MSHWKSQIKLRKTRNFTFTYLSLCCTLRTLKDSTNREALSCKEYYWVKDLGGIERIWIAVLQQNQMYLK